MPAAALAAEPSQPAELSGSLLQMVAGLAVVLLAVFAALYVVKRLATARGTASGLLKVVAAAPVGPRERVVMVEVGETWIVLGVAPGAVRALHSLPRLTGAESPATPPPGDFAQRLSALLKRRRRDN